MKITTFPGQFALSRPFWAIEDDQGGGEPEPITNSGEEYPAPDPEPEPDGGEETQPEDAGEESALEGDGGEDSQGGAGEDSLSAEAGDDEDPGEPKRRDWGLKRRVDKLTAAAKAAEERASAAEARAKTLEELYAKPEGERTDAERDAIRQAVRAEVSQEVRQEARIREINTKADKLFDDGKAAFPKTWERRVSNIGELFGEDLQKRPDFFEAVTELDNAPAVWHELGNDPETMDRLLGLTPAKMGIELARISTKLAVPKAPVISRAPAPIRPLDKQAVEDLPLDDPRVSMEEFNRRREAQWSAANRR